VAAIVRARTQNLGFPFHCSIWSSFSPFSRESFVLSVLISWSLCPGLGLLWDNQYPGFLWPSASGQWAGALVASEWPVTVEGTVALGGDGPRGGPQP
jgi:hypothetical protein